jgi:hypothetical protein
VGAAQPLIFFLAVSVRDEDDEASFDKLGAGKGGEWIFWSIPIASY